MTKADPVKSAIFFTPILSLLQGLARMFIYPIRKTHENSHFTI